MANLNPNFIELIDEMENERKSVTNNASWIYLQWHAGITKKRMFLCSGFQLCINRDDVKAHIPPKLSDAYLARL